MSNEINYEIIYDESFERQVEEQGTNPLLNLRIEIEGEEIKGADEDESHLDDYIGMHITKLLNSVSKLRKGETVEFHFYSHSQVLLLEPENGTLFLACSVPSEIGGITDDEMYTVEKEAFVREVIRAADEFVSKVIDVDEDFTNDKRIRQLKQRIAELRGTS